MPPRRATTTAASSAAAAASRAIGGDDAAAAGHAGVNERPGLERRMSFSFQSQALRQQRGAPRAARTLGPRAMVIEELVLTENDYARDLELVLKHFVLPVQKSRKSGQGPVLLSEQLERTVFCNFSELLDLAYGVLNQLEQLKRQRATGRKYRVGEVLAVMASEFKAYTTYAINFPAAVECVTQQRAPKVNPAFVAFEKEAFKNPDLAMMDILAYLIKPVQRITKYPLFISELLKHTPDSHPEYAFLIKAQSRMTAVVEYINERKAAFENRLMLRRIASRIDKLPTDAGAVPASATRAADASAAAGGGGSGSGSGAAGSDNAGTKGGDVLDTLVRHGRKILLEFNVRVSLKDKVTNARKTAVSHVWLFDDMMLAAKYVSGRSPTGTCFADDKLVAAQGNRLKFQWSGAHARINVDMESALRSSKTGYSFSLSETPAPGSKVKKSRNVTFMFASMEDRDRAHEAVTLAVAKYQALALVAQQEEQQWDPVPGGGEKCIALYDYVSCGSVDLPELEFSKGDIIRVLEKPRAGGLFKGVLEADTMHAMVGVFPREFVEPVDKVELEDDDAAAVSPAEAAAAAESAARVEAEARVATASRMAAEMTAGAALPPPVIAIPSPEVPRVGTLDRKRRVMKSRLGPPSPEVRRFREGGAMRRQEPQQRQQAPRPPHRPAPRRPPRSGPANLIEDPNATGADDGAEASAATPAAGSGGGSGGFDAAAIDEQVIDGVVFPGAPDYGERALVPEPNNVGVCGIGVADELTDGSANACDWCVAQAGALSVFGVFDGQEGRGAVDFVARNAAIFAEHFDSSLGAVPDVGEVMGSSFMAMDAHLVRLADEGTIPMGASASGVLLAVAPVPPKKLAVVTANIGDTRAILSRADGTTTRLTVDHIPSDLEEARRVQECDGQILDGRVNATLHVTRAFGASDLKAYGVTADPHVAREQVPASEAVTGGGHDVVILANSGLFDVVSDTDAAKAVRQMSDADMASNSSAQWMAEKLIAEAVRAGAKESLTALVVVLN